MEDKYIKEVSESKQNLSKSVNGINDLILLYREYKDDIFGNDIELAKKRVESLHAAYRSLSLTDKLKILSGIASGENIKNNPDIANTIALIDIKKYTIYTIDILVIISLTTLAFYVLNSDDLTVNWFMSTGLTYIKIIFGL